MESISTMMGLTMSRRYRTVPLVGKTNRTLAGAEANGPRQQNILSRAYPTFNLTQT